MHLGKHHLIDSVDVRWLTLRCGTVHVGEWWITFDNVKLGKVAAPVKMWMLALYAQKEIFSLTFKNYITIILKLKIKTEYCHTVSYH